MVLLQLDYLSPIANIEEYILFMTTFPRRDQGTPEGGKIFYNIGYTIHIRSIATFWSSAFSLPIRFFSNVFQLSSSSFGISLVFLLWTVTAVRAWITWSSITRFKVLQRHCLWSEEIPCYLHFQPKRSCESRVLKCGGDPTKFWFLFVCLAAPDSPRV